MKTVNHLTYSSIQRDPGVELWGDEASAAPPETQQGLSISQVLAILRHYWKIAAAVIVTITALSFVALKLLPKSYTAIATMVVSADRRNPLASQDIEYALPSYTQTQMELMLSPVVLGPVMDRMQLTKDPEFAAGYGAQDIAGLREYTLRNLARSLQVELGRGGQLIYVSASSKSPDKAADMANTLADAYMEEEQRRISDPANARARRYSEDLVELRSKVATAQRSLAAYRQQNGLTSISTGAGNSADSETEALSNLEARLLEAQNTRRQLEAKSAGQQSTADETLASPLVLELKSQLSKQQAQLAQYSATYGPQHPKVLELKSQIAATSSQFDSELLTLSRNTSTQLARARDLESKFSNAIAAQRSKVLRLREQQGEGAKLTLELDSAQAVYKRALDGYDQIMFASSGDNANVSMVSRATAPVKATKPNKLKLLLMCFAASLALGLGGPLAYELLIDRRLRCRDDFERSFGIPVLAQFDVVPVAAAAA